MGQAEQADEVLARRARSGDRSAFDALVLRWEAPLRRFLRLHASHQAEADEFAHDALVRAWLHLHSYQPDRAFAPWLFTVARSVALSSHRQRARRPLGDIPEDLVDPRRAPPDELASREGCDNLWALACRVLGPDQRAALWLRHVEGFTPGEVADVLGKRAGTVRVLLHRARSVLARHVPQPGGGAEDPEGADARRRPCKVLE